MTTSARATALGIGAILLWAILAALGALAGKIPPFQLVGVTFAIATAVGLAYLRASGLRLASLRDIPPRALAVSVYGLLGFHVCYFFAIQNAPVLEASLVTYLWPLLIVVFTGLLPGLDGRLRWWHVAGALVGFSGTALLILGDGGAKLTVAGAVFGLAMAFAAAFVWASYSVALRLFPDVPVTATVAACAVTAIAGWLLHVALEPATVWPASALGFAAMVALGLGPIGLAFYFWDAGMKRGDIRFLGVASYATPLLSTLVLWTVGLGKASSSLWLAAGLITAGAVVASLDKFTGRT